MIFFMSKKNLDRYVAEYIERNYRENVESYIQEQVADVRGQGEENAKALWNKIQNMNSGVNSIHEIVEKLERKDKDSSTYNIKKEIENCVEGMKSGLVKDITADVLSKIPKSEVNITDVESLVENAITRYMKENSQMPDNVKMELASLKTELNANINGFFQGVNQEMARKNAETGQIWEWISGEKRKIADLEDIIKKQKKDIEELLVLVQQLENKISSLSISIPEVSVQKPIQEPDLKGGGAAYPASAIMTHNCIFDEDSAVCKSTLRNFILQSQKLRSKIQQLSFNGEEMEIYLKLVDKCVRKFEDLEKKYDEKSCDSGKLAHDAAKILKQTIIRAMSQKGLKQYLEQYMDACYVRNLEWKIGRKLTDEDYSYLEEPISYEEVSEPGLHNTIIAIMQDTFAIDYREEEGCFEAIIPGIYSIGKYRN